MRESPVAVIVDGSTGNTVPAVADGTGINRLATDARITGSSGLAASVVADGSIRRLSVDVRGSGINAAQMVIKYLANASSSVAMDSASGTAAAPVRFFYTPPTGMTATITRLLLQFEGTGYLQNGVSFMNQLSSLTNGLQVGAIVSGVPYVIGQIRQNEDMFLLGNPTTVSTANGGTLLGLNLGTVTSISMTIPLAQPLSAAAGDSISVWVRDNLNALGNGLLYCRAVCSGYLTS